MRNEVDEVLREKSEKHVERGRNVGMPGG